METFHSTASRPRVLIADDHTVFAEALCVYLEKTFDVVGVVADGRAMLEQSNRLRPDVIVADVSMPLLNGLDAARRISEKTPNVKFVFLTMLDDLNLAAAALELGPVAFVLKSSGGWNCLRRSTDFAWPALRDSQDESWRLGRRKGQGPTVFKGLDQTTARYCAVVR
jgi:DNA-binding NarL/FixJ family response regulator